MTATADSLFQAYLALPGPERSRFAEMLGGDAAELVARYRRGPAERRRRVDQRCRAIAELIDAGHPAKTSRDWDMLRTVLFLDPARRHLVLRRPIPADVALDLLHRDRLGFYLLSVTGIRRAYAAWRRRHPDWAAEVA